MSAVDDAAVEEVAVEKIGLEERAIEDVPVQRPPSTSKVVSQKINRGLSWFEGHWLLAFNAFWGIFVLLPWTAPLFMRLGWTIPGRIVYFIYNFFCHQLPERSWFLFGPKFSYTQAEIGQFWDISNELVRRQFIGNSELGWKVAWSDRMVAMYTTIFVLGLVYALLRNRGITIRGIPWWGFILLITPLAIDGTTHLINDALRLSFRDANQWAVVLTNQAFASEFYVGDLFGSLNSVLRLITGFFFGLGVVLFLWPMMEKEFGRSKIYPTHQARM